MPDARLIQLQTWLDSILRQYGIRVVITSGDRTCADQARVNPTQIRSFHLTGQAIDIDLQPDWDAGSILSGVYTPILVEGIELLNQYKPELQEWVGSWAEYYGFRWGGRFKQRDPVHVDTGDFNLLGECFPTRGGRVDPGAIVVRSTARGGGVASGAGE